MNIDNQMVIQIFYKMMKSRLFEEKAVSLKEQGLISDSLCLSFGQEATAAAVCALESDDIIFASHRCFCAAIAADIEPSLLFSELLANPEGLCLGRSGAGAIADNTVNFYGTSSLSGAAFSKACGAAMSLKLQNKKNVVVCFAGDGAASSGDLYEAINIACLKKLPIVFFIENNCYAGLSRTENISSTTDISERARAFDIPGLVIDGNSAPDVYDTMTKACEFARENGPVLVESKTYRLAGHIYEEEEKRSEEEIGQWVAYDTLENMKEYMVENGIGILEDLVMLRNRIKSEIDAAAEEAAQIALKDITEEKENTTGLDVSYLLVDMDEQQ